MYFLSLAIKKFDAIIILLMRRVWETKHLFFWPKLVEPLHEYTACIQSCTCTCSYFLFQFFTCNNFLIVWHSIVLLPVCEYIKFFSSFSRRWDWNQNTLFLYVRKTYRVHVWLPLSLITKSSSFLLHGLNL